MNLLFAWRYFKAKKSTNAINIISWVSVVAIVLITAAFIILLSVFNGFEGLVKSLYSTFYADLRIVPKEGKSITVTPLQFSKMRAIVNIKAISKIVEEKTLLQNGEIQTIVYLKGVDENYKDVTAVPQKMIRGQFDLGTSDEAFVVLGSGIENALSLISDRNLYPVTAYLFKRGVNIDVVDPYQAFSAENVATSGTFFIQQDIDNKYAITNIGFMKKMLSMAPDEYGSIEIALRDNGRVDQTKNELKKIFGAEYVIESRYEQNKSLYSVMNLEKWAIYGILTLMMIVAAFTMIGALTMLVLEKQKDIQILKALGADNQRIRKIFLSEGLLLASMGALAGLVLAVVICWAQVQYKLIRIEGGTFLIDHYPVELRFSDFVLVMVTVMLIAFLASWFPARKAALQPVELKS
ncbi:MAG: ABC transporter permease [Chitinophagaceae bacterium]|nr:ABC transporter permease [Chitinophagaceae bacterium]